MYKWNDKKDTVDNALTVFGKGLIDSFIRDEDEDDCEPQQTVEISQCHEQDMCKKEAEVKKIVIDKRTVNITNIQVNGNSNYISSNSQHEARRRNKARRRRQ